MTVASSSSVSGQGDDELLAAEPADHVLRPDRAAQDGRDRPQRLVADQVAVPVVDLLEVVDVDQQHCHRLALVPRDARSISSVRRRHQSIRPRLVFGSVCASDSSWPSSNARCAVSVIGIATNANHGLTRQRRRQEAAEGRGGRVDAQVVHRRRRLAPAAARARSARSPGRTARCRWRRRPSPPRPSRRPGRARRCRSGPDAGVKTACAAPTASTWTAVEKAQRYGMHLPARIRHQIRSRSATRIASAGWSTIGGRDHPGRREVLVQRAAAPSPALDPAGALDRDQRRDGQCEHHVETAPAEGSSAKACAPYPIAARSTSTTTANAGTVRVHSAQCRTARLLCATITPHGTTSERLVPIRDGALWMTMWKRWPTVENSVV